MDAKWLVWLLLASVSVLRPQNTPVAQRESESIPVVTQWLLDAVGPSGRAAVKAVFKVYCPKTQNLGTAFSLDTSYLITNEHVVRGCNVQNLAVISTTSQRLAIASMTVDANRDLAVLKPTDPLPDGLRVRKAVQLQIGTQLSAWGYPFAHPGPAPLLTVGYLSGFAESRAPNQKPVKRLIINGAFNPGNSGGPLLCEGAVVGVVVSKQTFSIPPDLQSALTALAENISGVTFSAMDAEGRQFRFVESQLVAQLLTHFHRASQVFIGEAIAEPELTAFLTQNGIPWNWVEPATKKTR